MEWFSIVHYQHFVILDFKIFHNIAKPETKIKVEKVTKKLVK